MAWFKVDDGFHSHPKVMALSAADVGIWTLAGTWCAQYLTDGQIPLGVIVRLGGTRENADALVAADLWTEDESETFTFRDWADYQPSSESVKADREAARERMRRVRQNKRERSAGVRANTDRSSDEVRSTQRSADVPKSSVNPDPTRPDPTSNEVGEGAATPTPTRPRAHRLPDGWTPSPELRDAMHHECPGVDLVAEHRKFSDYWRSQPDSKARKVDWDATWRNWIRRAAESNTRRTTHTERSHAAGAALFDRIQNGQWQPPDTTTNGPKEIQP